MQTDLDTIRCEDCARHVAIAHSTVTDAGLVCKDCATSRASAPLIFVPMWTRLRRAIGIARRN